MEILNKIDLLDLEIKFLKVRTNQSYITSVHWHYIKLKIFLKRIKLTRNIDAADIML